MSTRASLTNSISSIAAAASLIGCTSTSPPPLPLNNPADPHARASSPLSSNVLGRDETSAAVQSELSATKAQATSAQSMHDMSGMQQGGMTMEHDEAHKTDGKSETKALTEEMKKTADEMKQTSDAMKQQSDQKTSQNFYYTCVMHPQIHADGPGKCPICGMTLIKKETAPQ